ncbi:MAG: hypothetical protein P8P49_12910 [Opitutales bacterium]|nr:hypothetical protein [Opitutales bacterium]
MKISLNNEVEELALRIDEDNLNHHLWNNNGTWWIHYTVYPSSVTAERKRYSLKTKDVTIARLRRDNHFDLIVNRVPELAA